MEFITENFLKQLITILKPLDKSGLSVRQIIKKINADPDMKAHFKKMGKDAAIIKKAAAKRRKEDPTFDAIHGMLDKYLDA